jgi:tetratricopeptide (TPR) repeat protein
MLLAGALVFPAVAAADAADKPKVRVERYEIDVTFRPEESFLRAKTSVTLRALQAVEAIEFELNPRLEIDEVTDAQGRRLEVHRSGRLGSPKLLVRLAEACPAEQGVTLTFSYRGTIDSRGGLDYITRDGILLGDEARWYPAVDLAAFTENDISITVPPGWHAVSSGENVEKRSTDAASTYRWKTTHGVSSRSVVAYPKGADWLCVAVPGDKSWEPELTYPVESCFASNQMAASLRTQRKLAEALHAYAQRLGSHPRPKLSLVKGFPKQRGAIGYSAPGLLVVSEDVLKYDDYPGYAPEFLPYEIAHQWFPLQVTLASQADGWLAEGLAEYLAWRYLLDKDPEQARVMVERAMRDALEPEPPRPLSLGLNLFATETWEVTRATLYDRGLLVFRTLETVIGRSRVDAALRELYKRHSGRSASIADFRKICEEISGRDLGWFFEYFINGTQIPEIELRRLPAAAPGETLGEIVLRNVPADFQVRVEMRINTTKGIVEHSVATRGAVTAFTANVAGPVTSFTLDPDLRILRWTDAARRHRQQRALLADLGDLERAHQFAGAIKRCEEALQADPDDLARNHQQIYFQLGRLHVRRGLVDRAQQYFTRALERVSIDPATTDFYRAWSRVYRARLASRQGDAKTARAEAEAGLALKSPVLDTEATWPEAPLRKASAGEELAKFLR